MCRLVALVALALVAATLAADPIHSPVNGTDEKRCRDSLTIGNAQGLTLDKCAAMVKSDDRCGELFAYCDCGECHCVKAGQLCEPYEEDHLHSIFRVNKPAPVAPGSPTAEPTAAPGFGTTQAPEKKDAPKGKVCEVDTDYEGDVITHYDCKVQGVDADTCTKAGGKVEEDGKQCSMNMGGLGWLDPSSGPALSKDKRNAACAKIGGIPTPVTCDTMIGFSIIAVPTSKDQCNLPGGLLGYVAGLTHAKGMEWLGPKCCSGKKHHELCKGVEPKAKGKMCEVEADFDSSGVVLYDCKVNGVDADECSKAGGKVEDDGKQCSMNMGGLGWLDPSSGPALSEADRNAACAKIGGTPNPVTCGTIMGQGYLGLPRSKDQCNAPTSMHVKHMTQAQALEWLGPKCCGSGKKYSEVCKGVAGKPEAKVCKVDSDWTPDAYFSFDCENKGLDKTKCVDNGGEYSEGDKNCELDMKSFTTDAARSKECDKIGAVPKGNTCATVKMLYAPIITSEDQCSLIDSQTKLQNEVLLQMIGKECCGGKAINDICGGPRELCEGGDADFNPTKSSQWPTDPGKSAETCGTMTAYAASALPAKKQDCTDPADGIPNVTKSNVLEFLAYHCCTSRKPAKTCGGRQESMCPGDEGGWANFVDTSYRKECKFVDVELSQSDCKVIGGRWETVGKDAPKCNPRDDMTDDECTKAGGTLQDVTCSQNGILYKTVLDQAGCSAPPTADADQPTSWYVDKMGASCCKSKASRYCTISVEAATTAKAAADKAFKDAGCDTDVTKAGCNTLKATKDAADAGLVKSQNARAAAETTTAAETTAAILSVDAATAAKAAADKAYKDAGCDTDATNATKADCASLKAKKDAAAANLKKALDAGSSAGITCVASSAAMLVASAVAVAGF